MEKRGSGFISVPYSKSSKGREGGENGSDGERDPSTTSLRGERGARTSSLEITRKKNQPSRMASSRSSEEKRGKLSDNSKTDGGGQKRHRSAMVSTAAGL